MMSMDQTAPTRFALPPMRYGSVPAVDARSWIVISLASVFGCNSGDFVAAYLHFGHWHGLIPLALVFILLLAGERSTGRGGEAWYWASVIVLRTAATNLADLGTHNFNWAYPWVIAGLETVLVLAVVAVPPRLRPVGSDRASRPATDGWYWLSLLTAGTLGTAIGDCVAEEFGLGTGIGTLLLGGIMAVILGVGSRSGWATKASYWLAIVAVRAGGTTAGDFIASRSGLGLGLVLSTACTGAIFVVTLLLWRAKPSGGAAPATAP